MFTDFYSFDKIKNIWGEVCSVYHENKSVQILEYPYRMFRGQTFNLRQVQALSSVNFMGLRYLSFKDIGSTVRTSTLLVQNY